MNEETVAKSDESGPGPGPIWAAAPIWAEVSETMRHSPELGELAKALAAAQLEFKPVFKDADNPAYMRGARKAMYATLAAVISATQPAMAKYGLVLIQMPSVNGANKTMTLVSTLLHTSGQWVENNLTMPAIMQGNRYDVQSIGSAITYARRYSYQGMVGVAPEEDDDGNAAAGVGSRDAANAVGDRKVRELKKKLGKEEPATSPVPKALFYTLPERHNGHEALLVNLKEFGAGLDQVAAEGLKAVLKKYVHMSKAGDILVVREKLDELIGELNRYGVEIHELGAND